MSLHTYLPQDRRRALARNATLPDRGTGSALFANLSGFTPLTEKLRDPLGPRRGTKERSRQLEAVFTALIAEVKKHGGSIIGFAGDAKTCWFEDRGQRAARGGLCPCLAICHASLAYPGPQSLHRHGPRMARMAGCPPHAAA